MWSRSSTPGSREGSARTAWSSTAPGSRAPPNVATARMATRAKPRYADAAIGPQGRRWHLEQRFVGVGMPGRDATCRAARSRRSWTAAARAEGLRLDGGCARPGRRRQPRHQRRSRGASRRSDLGCAGMEFGCATRGGGSRSARSRPRRASQRPPRAASAAERAAVLALVVRAVVARADGPPPPRVVAVPGDGALEALLEAHPRPPSRARAPSRSRGSSGGRGPGGR